MSRFRSHWLALFGGVTLIALSMSSAFAGKPDGTHPGLQVSAYVHSLVGNVEETDADTETADEAEAETPDDTETTDETEVSVEDASSDHGACVSAVAQDKEAVGGDNENHGGAVSEAARVTCQGEAAADEPKADEPTEDAADTEVESDEDAAPESETEDAGKGNGRGDSHGDDSSDD